jgi:glycine cleavage system H lipoate-binding protein
VTVGIDDVAQSLAGPIVSCPPKKAGRAVPKGQSVATIEASKWVGPGAGPGDGRDRRGQRGRETGSGAAER